MVVQVTLLEALLRPAQGRVLRLAALPLGLMRREVWTGQRLERQPLPVRVMALPVVVQELLQQPPDVERTRLVRWQRC